MTAPEGKKLVLIGYMRVSKTDGSQVVDLQSDALVAAGRDGAKLCLGVFVMLLLAAFIEAFWSSKADLPDLVRFPLAAALWIAIFWWLAMGGRGRTDAD